MSDPIEIFKWLHMHPEVGYHEIKTTEKITELLTEMGIEICDTDLRCGVIAVVRGKNNGKSIAVRADIDALPVCEESGVEYASLVPGVMHACGHDLHTAVAIATAERLTEMRDELCGNVYFAFESAEEILGGAEALLNTGALDDVSEFYALHCDPSLDVGEVGIIEGGVMVAFDRFDIEVRGIGTHAATPHLGKNPIPILVSLISRLTECADDGVDPSVRRVISFTGLSAGTAWNVIPDTASCVCSVRTFDDEARERIRYNFSRAASECPAECTVRLTEGPPSVINDPELCKAAREASEKAGLKPVTFVPELLSDDFSYLPRSGANTKGAYLKLGVGKGHPLHSPRFKADTSAIEAGIKLMTELLISGLK